MKGGQIDPQPRPAAQKKLLSKTPALLRLTGFLNKLILCPA